ncbi:MAG: response regulator transcription factor [Crocinitomicaceae bacterium]|nr:response regulator transcription factor [Flavobacteriales bacterium]NQZ38402.1 response regulator transcription factor [Crocinitomicaceae bacterium]
MTKIYIVEDNSSHLELLKLKVEMLGYELVGFSQTTLNTLVNIQTTNPDVVLVDINLNRDKDGITLAHEIKEFTNAKVIFITSQSKSEVIADAVTAKPSGYLIKPIDPDELRANIELAVYKKNEKHIKEKLSDEFLTVRTGEKLQLVSFKNIKFLKVEIKNYVTLIDDQDKQFVVRDSLKNMLINILPSTFIRTHHGYGVNIDFVSFIDEKEQTIYLKTNDSIPIGKSFRKLVYEKMNIKS